MNGGNHNEDNGGSALPADALPVEIVRRLAAEDVTTAAQWRAFGPRRLEIFGLTKAHVALIDAALKAAL